MNLRLREIGEAISGVNDDGGSGDESPLDAPFLWRDSSLDLARGLKVDERSLHALLTALGTPDSPAR
jgi:hypothetical protein